MSEETENETVILENPTKVPISGTNAGGKHPRHNHEVVAKPGQDSITMEPAADHPHRERYVRTEDTDEQGRAIFRMENA